MKQQLLFLHGAGKANKDRHNYILEELQKEGIATFSFNFSGHSGIDLEGSGVSKRYKEAKGNIARLKLAEPLNLMGSSMGAYICLKLSEEFEVANLILFCPSMYSTKLFNIPFGPEFTEIIRDKDSWRDTDAFEIAKKFAGNVIVVTGGQEEVVPKELTKTLIDSFTNATYLKVIEIPEATHALGEYIQTNPKLLKEITKEISSLL